MNYSLGSLSNQRTESHLGDSILSLDTLICPYIDEFELYSAELYSNRTIEISIITEGSGTHRMLNQAVPCTVGDIYVLNSNIPHRFFASEPGARLVVRRILFEPRHWLDKKTSAPSEPGFCHGVFDDNAMTAYAMLTDRVKEKIEAYFDLIAVELVEKKTEWKNAIRAHLSMLLINIGRYVNRAIKSLPSVEQTEWGPVSAAILAINENYSDKELTLEAIAESFFISKSQLSRLFNKFTGESFSDYLRNRRLTGACQLLAQTDMTIEEIADSCGLRDVPTFYRIFNKYIGMTPNTYRKSHKEQKGENIMSILTEISENLQRGKAKIVKELVAQAIEQGVPADDILSDGLLNGMSIIGEKFKNNEVYVPEVLVAARAMNMGTEILKPYIAESGITAAGRVCIGTVQGDLHDIGKNLVKMMMEGKGLEVIDLGTDVAPEAFVNAAVENNCQIICCSALLTTTMEVMGEVVKSAEAAGIRDKVKIMVGGAPVTDEFCRKIGADCYTSDAASAADAAVALCKG